MARKVPDFIYWTLFVVLVVMHYFTKTFGAPEHGTVEFFTVIWLASFIGLIALKVWAPEPREEIVDYDENLQRWHLGYCSRNTGRGGRRAGLLRPRQPPQPRRDVGSNPLLPAPRRYPLQHVRHRKAGRSLSSREGGEDLEINF